MSFSSNIIAWYNKNHRELPWRKTKNPYLIWLSEIILQQTRVDQGLNYYLRITEKFPTVKKLAAAKQDEVLKMWQGLGYYSRARNLHHAAKQITDEFKGRFPTEYEDIKSLKGVGDYTSAAIASIAYDLPYPVLDGNVFRLLSRCFAIETPIDSGKGKKEFLALAEMLIDKKNPSLFNQAMMEMGALVCTPAQPKCISCPLQKICLAFKNKSIQNYPVKSKKVAIKNRFLHFVMYDCNGKTIIHQRNEKDIWQGLYDFPSIETEKALSKKMILKKVSERKSAIKSVIEVSITPYAKHILTHRHLFCSFIHLKTSTLPELLKDEKVIPLKNIHRYSLPRIIDGYLNNEIDFNRKKQIQFSE